VDRLPSLRDLIDISKRAQGAEGRGSNGGLVEGGGGLVEDDDESSLWWSGGGRRRGSTRRWMGRGWRRGRQGVVLVEGGGGLVEGDCRSSAVVVWLRPTKGAARQQAVLSSFYCKKGFPLSPLR
jgi:hypothetical protein